MRLLTALGLASCSTVLGLHLPDGSVPEADHLDLEYGFDLEVPGALFLRPAWRPAPPPWPFPEPSSTDVWVFDMNRRPVNGMYHPLYYTLVEGFSAMGKGVNLAQFRGANLLETVNASLAAGRPQMVIAVAWWFALPETKAQLEALGRTPGCHVVLYQTEPPGAGERLSPAVIAEDIKRYNAKEVWDYSRSNLACCYPAGTGASFRFVPPGAAAALDLGVDLEAAGRVESRMAFVGQWRYRSGPTKQLYGKALGDSFEAHDNIWGPDALRQHLSQYPVQVNLHKSDDAVTATMPMESFRLSLLLMNKACVISSHVSPVDQEVWKDVVHIAPPGEMVRVFAEVQQDVRGCQMKGYKLFKQRFAPKRLFEDAGVYDVWRPLLMTSGSPHLA